MDALAIEWNKWTQGRQKRKEGPIQNSKTLTKLSKTIYMDSKHAFSQTYIERCLLLLQWFKF